MKTRKDMDMVSIPSLKETIREAQEKCDNAAEAISELLWRFTEETGLVVNDIRIASRTMEGKLFIQLDVRL